MSFAFLMLPAINACVSLLFSPTVCHSIFELALVARYLAVTFRSNLLPQAAESMRLSINTRRKLTPIKN